MLLLLISIFVLSICNGNESSCISKCSKTSFPQCGTWLSQERIIESGGTYELGKGIVNMSCVFSSLPSPSKITWMHRNELNSQWNPFTCSTKDDHIQCNTDNEHKVSSQCIIRLNQLNMTGVYKCEAVTKSDRDTDTKAYSSEVGIEVVGIESVRILDRSLKSGRSGYVEAQICSNPRPEVWWTTSEGLLKPGDSLKNFASSHLAKSLTRIDSSGPGLPIPYCYQLRLITRYMKKDDNLSILVRSHESVQTVHIINSSSIYFSSYAIYLLGFLFSLYQIDLIL